MKHKFKKTKNISARLISFRKNKGFSLPEVMIAMFIFSIIMTASVATFISAFSARNSARISQKGLEESRTAMEAIAKNIRMSIKVDNIASNRNKISMFNMSQGKCIAYSSSSGVLRGVMTNPTDNPGDVTYPTCLFPAETSWEVLISQGASAWFDVTKTNTLSNPRVVGKATIKIDAEVETAKNHLQTTISFRDYEGIVY